MRLDGSAKLGPYEILEPLGVGGMCEVYKARATVNCSVSRRQALRSSSVSRWDRAPAYDLLTFLLNFFIELKRRVPVEGSRTENGPLAAS
jgi:hypothetical protein